MAVLPAPCLLLLLLAILSSLILAQDDCKAFNHCLPNWVNGTYYIRPDGSENALCPAQPCLTPTELRDYFTACSNKVSCKTSNTSLVLLPGTYTTPSNGTLLLPPSQYFSLSGYTDCNSSTLPTASIDCHGTWIPLPFQRIKCVQVYNCVMLAGFEVDIEYAVFNDTMIRMSSSIVDNSTHLQNYTPGSQNYCLLQKQLSENVSMQSNSRLVMRNVLFSSHYLSRCSEDYNILLTTIIGFESSLEFANCTFSQELLNHISLYSSTFYASGTTQFQLASTAIEAVNSTIGLGGNVQFSGSTDSAISTDAQSTINVVGVVNFTRNTGYQGGAIVSSNIVLANDAEVTFHGNHAATVGGAIFSPQNLTLGGKITFIGNSAALGGAIYSHAYVTIANSAQIVFLGNHVTDQGGAIFSSQTVTLEGMVKFLYNTAISGGAIVSQANSVIVSADADVLFQLNDGVIIGGAIWSARHVTIDGRAQFLNNSASTGGAAIVSHGNTVTSNSAQVVFENNLSQGGGGTITSHQNVSLGGSGKFVNNTSGSIGGAIIADVSLTITGDAQMIFQGNSAEFFGGAIFCKHLTIPDRANVTFQDNVAGYDGGAIYADTNENGQQNIGFGGYFVISDNAQVVFQGNHAINRGGAMYVAQTAILKGTCKVTFINNSANYGGAVAIDGGKNKYLIIAILDNAKVLFQGNRAYSTGGAIYSDQQISIQDAKVTFEGNSANNAAGAIIGSGEVTINSTQVIFRKNSAPFGGAAVAVLPVYFEGTLEFINNTALVGGAIYCDTVTAYVQVANYAHVIFQGNHAEDTGGAIAAKESDVSLFLQYTDNLGRITFETQSKIEFIDNTAKNGGSAVYGGQTTYSFCDLLFSAHQSHTHYTYENLFDILTFTADNYSSTVSSDPVRVCVCPDQSTPDCLAILPDQNIPHLHYTVYPGQDFTIPAAVVGFNFALTTGSVHTNFLNSDASLGLDFQYVQAISHTGCSQLQYRVLSANKHETLVLTSNVKRVVDSVNTNIAEDIEIQNSNRFSHFCEGFNVSIPNRYYRNGRFATNLTDAVFHLTGYVQQPLQDAPVFISLTLLDCPLGFTFSNNSRICECNERLLKNNLTCNITDQTVHRHSTIWVNASFSGNTSNGVIVHKHCPFEYCKPQQQDISLVSPYVQCAYNRYGTLCGACKPGLSLALGSSQCLQDCSNRFLSLFVAFIAAGLLLVFFIKILNLTVSQGTVNGLIFYANIVAANQSIFFPAEYNNLLAFLSVFISWLNLDLGIETCFIKGLDGYWKTWLQFVFPFYVWLIAGGIVTASHYSRRATKLFGKNSVSVLATLFLLSYGKLLRSTITTFGFTVIVLPDNSKSTLWAFDGNVPYVSPMHIALLLFCLVFVLLLWLPYTATLLSAQWLRTQTHRKHLRWLKPFLDAYYGPFKENHHYWVGVLLAVRGVLYIFFAFFAIENDVNLLLISIASVLILMYVTIPGRLYENIYLSVLENQFFLNLGVLAAGTLYIRLADGSQEALVTTSIGIVFLQFIAITIFHCYKFVIKPNRRCLTAAVCRAFTTDVDNADSEVDLLLGTDERVQPLTPVVTHSEVSLPELRAEAAAAAYSPSHTTPQAGGGQSAIPAKPPSQEGATVESTNSISGEETVDKNTPAVKSSSSVTELQGAQDDSTKFEERSVEHQPPPIPPPCAEYQSNGPPRYFAASRDNRFMDFSAPRETLLEYTEYHLPEERRQAQRTTEPGAAVRRDSIDFAKPRESLLDPM